MNKNQLKTIKSLEQTMDFDSPEAEERAKREDDLEKGAALLANLYFTKKNIQDLERRASSVNFSTGQDFSDDEIGKRNSDIQADFLKEVIDKKQQKWWKSLDGIFSYSSYTENQ